MKKVIALFTLLLSVVVANSQDGNWLNRTNYRITDNCIDSTQCLTRVTVDLNMSALADSTKVTFKVGLTYGTTEFDTKELIVVPSIFDRDDVVADSLGNAIVFLGDYLDNGELHVNVLIE